MPDRVRIPAHAKINLFLRILSREASGFHGIETAFVLLDLADELVVERIADGVELEVEGADTGPVESNLAYRAAETLLAAVGGRFGVRIQLTKHIPVRAGLGGGSSDAAATLHAVNALADQAVPRHEMIQLAARLGSDVPFFASGAALALGWNRGERLFRLRPPPPAPVLLAVPDLAVSTPDAYAWYDRATPAPTRRGTVVFDVDAFNTWGDIGRLGGNDFETVVFGEHSRLRDLFERVAETRPTLVRMSGSGSTICAVYKTPGELEDAVMTVGTKGGRLLTTSTRAAPAPAPERVS